MLGLSRSREVATRPIARPIGCSGNSWRQPGSVSEAGPNGNCGVFLTNAVLCFRTEGGCQGPVQLRWFRNCGTQFLRPQIDLIAPQFVICMGQRAYEGTLAAYSLPQPQNWRAGTGQRGAVAERASGVRRLPLRTAHP
jgi:uracil-DNA glycosylase